MTTTNGNVTIQGTATINGFTLSHRGAEFQLGGNVGRGDGGLALVQDGGDTLSINHTGTFAGGTRMDGNVVHSGNVDTRGENWARATSYFGSSRQTFIQGREGRNMFNDAEGAGRVRLGAAWGIPGIYSEDGQHLVLGAATGFVWVGPDGAGQHLRVNGDLYARGTRVVDSGGNWVGPELPVGKSNIVGGSCPAGQFVTVLTANGTMTCAAPAAGAGAAAFTYLDGGGDDTSGAAFRAFLSGIAGIQPAWFIFFEVNTNGQANGGAWCSDNANWYVTNYLNQAGAPASGAWNKWHRSEGGGWAQQNAGFTNYFGPNCDGVANSWCSEWGLGGRYLAIMPDQPNAGESYAQAWSSGRSWRVNIKVGSARAAVCGF